MTNKVNISEIQLLKICRRMYDMGVTAAFTSDPNMTKVELKSYVVGLIHGMNIVNEEISETVDKVAATTMPDEVAPQQVSNSLRQYGGLYLNCTLFNEIGVEARQKLVESFCKQIGTPASIKETYADWTKRTIGNTSILVYKDTPKMVDSVFTKILMDEVIVDEKLMFTIPEKSKK